MLEGSLELAAGGVDVAATGATNEGGNAGVAEALLEGGHVLRGGLVEGHAGTGVPDDQVDLGTEILQQSDKFIGVLWLVVDAAEQDVLEGDAFAGTERHCGDGVEQSGDVPLARDGHDGLADDVV